MTEKLMQYTAYMFVLPIATFYFLWVIVFDSDPTKLEWAGVGAVVAANIVICLYVYMAWTEEDDHQKTTPSLPAASKRVGIIKAPGNIHKVD